MYRVPPPPPRPRLGLQLPDAEPEEPRLPDVIFNSQRIPVIRGSPHHRFAARALGGHHRPLPRPARPGRPPSPLCNRKCLISLIALNLFALIICATAWIMYRHSENRAAVAVAEPMPAGPDVIRNGGLDNNYMPRSTLMKTAGQGQEDYKGFAHWHQSGVFYRDADGDLMVYDFKTKTSRMKATDYMMKLTAKFTVSADGKFILLEEHNMFNVQIGHRDLFRYSYFEIEPLKLYLKYLSPLEGNVGNVGLLQGAVFGPIGSQVAFVQDHNIYYKSSIDNTEICHQVTHSGSVVVSHGITDYGYDGVLFDEPTAMWFSPDGRYLAWLTFDEKGVPERYMPRQHPFIGMRKWSHLFYHLPLVDRYGPLVNVSFVRLADAHIRDVHVIEKPNLVARMRRNSEAIVTAVHWTADTRLVIVWTSRLMQIAHIQVCKTSNTCEDVPAMFRKGGWLLIRQPLHTNRVGNQLMLAVVLPPANRTTDLNKQIHLISLKSPHTSHVIHSEFDTVDVTRILHWGAEENVIFFLGSEPTMPERQHVYAIFVELETSSMELRPSVCLTCIARLSNPSRPTFYSHFEADFQANSSRLMLWSQGPSVPRIDMMQWTVLDGIDEMGDPNRVVELRGMQLLNYFPRLRSTLYNVTLPRIRYESLALSNNATGLHARVKLMLPDGVLQCTGSERLPLLVRAYNGPGTYAGSSKFEILWDSYYAVNRSVVVAVVDARGSGRMGMDMQYAIYRQLGTAEAADLLDVVGQLTRRFRCIDPDRVGMWGDQSYSSYLVGMTMAADQRNMIKCGHMVQPFSDFRKYNALNVERYMGFYMSEMYRRSSLAEQTGRLRDKSVQLVHASESMFYDVSIELAKKMKRDEVLLEELEYPVDLPWRQDRIYLYEVMTNYFDHCFKISPKRKQYRSIQN